MRRSAIALFLVLVTPLAMADRVDEEAEEAEEPTLLERLMVTPPDDAYSDDDRKRAKVQRSLPELGTEEPPEPSGFDQFLMSVANADINKASPGQKKMINKLSDPDFNRLPP
jgi:hypothetical protein